MRPRNSISLCRRRPDLNWRCLAIALITSTTMACQGSPGDPESAADPQAADHQAAVEDPRPITQRQLQAAIDQSAQYLARSCNAQGRFTYRIHLDPDEEVEPAYNVLRHAGSVYALAQYCEYATRIGSQVHPEIHPALRRAARFLRDECFGPVGRNPKLLAVWSDPELGSPSPRQAKLGGTGLGLVALLSAERVGAGCATDDELTKLGRFVVFMQKSDGSFYSKYYPTHGRDDRWQSMYYPGEAALGLLLLYEHDPSPHWFHAATKAMDYLARPAASERPTMPDQWFLLALEQWIRIAPSHADEDIAHRLLRHARRLCDDMLNEQQHQLDIKPLRGCFTSQGRTCPTATRLEGLLAAMQFLPPHDSALRDDIRTAVARGMLFLLDSQVVEGPHAGAMPRFKPGFLPPDVGAGEQSRLWEVRIDYVQHALSAMIAYHDTWFGPDKPLASPTIID